jgi:hypothetical protein
LLLFVFDSNVIRGLTQSKKNKNNKFKKKKKKKKKKNLKKKKKKKNISLYLTTYTSKMTKRRNKTEE